MIETFVSRPNWVPSVFELRLAPFYQLLEDMGFKANTIGKSQVPLMSPFEDVHALMKKCKCTVVLGLPQIFIHTGAIKQVQVESTVTLPTEWNQIEATISIMEKLPTLVLLHKNVAARGIFERGAANLFVHEFNVLTSAWPSSVRPALTSLKNAIG